ncbi:hypothetical protein Tco_0096974 [Tanacetum coccineum]
MEEALLKKTQFEEDWKSISSPSSTVKGRTEEVASIGATPQNKCYCSKIRQTEIKEELRKMGRNKVVGPNEILIEAWRCHGVEGARQKELFRRLPPSRVWSRVARYGELHQGHYSQGSEQLQQEAASFPALMGLLMPCSISAFLSILTCSSEDVEWHFVRAT